MWFVLSRQNSISFKQLHHYIKCIHLIATLLATFEILFKRPCIFNSIHQSFISWLNKSEALLAV